MHVPACASWVHGLCMAMHPCLHGHAPMACVLLDHITSDELLDRLGNSIGTASSHHMGMHGCAWACMGRAWGPAMGLKAGKGGGEGGWGGGVEGSWVFGDGVLDF
jgi:hypothetical protein